MPELVAEPEKQEERQMNSMSLLQHLEELRRRIIYSAVSVAVCTGIGWWFVRDKIFPFIQKPIIEALVKNNQDPHLTYLNPTDPFNMYLKVGLMAGVFMACPIILYQLWMFISPGLYRREKKFIIPFLLLSVGLFLSGGTFAYKVVFPVAMEFLINYSEGFKATVTVSEYTGLFLTIILGMSVIFELPIVLGFAALMGVVDAKFLLRHIRGAVLLFFIVAAVLSPTTDIMNMTIYAAPMVLLYIMSIGIAWLVHPKQRRKREEKRKSRQD
jgi:sec-independent protein translocase protein TatC